MKTEWKYALIKYFLACLLFTVTGICIFWAGVRYGGSFTAELFNDSFIDRTVVSAIETSLLLEKFDREEYTEARKTLLYDEKYQLTILDIASRNYTGKGLKAACNMIERAKARREKYPQKYANTPEDEELTKLFQNSASCQLLKEKAQSGKQSDS